MNIETILYVIIGVFGGWYCSNILFYKQSNNIYLHLKEKHGTIPFYVDRLLSRTSNRELIGSLMNIRILVKLYESQLKHLIESLKRDWSNDRYTDMVSTTEIEGNSIRKITLELITSRKKLLNLLKHKHETETEAETDLKMLSTLLLNVHIKAILKVALIFTQTLLLLDNNTENQFRLYSTINTIIELDDIIINQCLNDLLENIDNLKQMKKDNLSEQHVKLINEWIKWAEDDILIICNNKNDETYITSKL